MSSNPTRRALRRWWRSLAPAALVFVVAVTASGAAAVMLGAAEHRHADAALTRRAENTRAAVAADARRYVDALQDLSVAVAAQSELTADDFAMITSRVRRGRLPGVGAVLFVSPAGQVLHGRAVSGPADQPPIPDDAQQPAYDPSGPDTTAAGRGEVAAAMAVARASSQVTASRALGPGAPVSLVFAGPVFAGPATPDAGTFRGWVLMTLRTAAFLDQTLRDNTDDTTDVTVTDATDPASPITVTMRPEHALGTGEFSRRVELTVAQRSWELTITTSGPLVSGAAAYSDEASFGGGVLIAILLAGVTWLLATSRERALAKVDQATAALRADIARRQMVEAQLRERESELAGFVAVAAHDLKTPLTNVAAYADLLAEVAAEDLDATCLGFVDRIGTGTRRMTRLIDDLLDFATAENAPLRPEPVDLRALVGEVVAEQTAHLSDAPNIDIGALPTVYGDPAALRRLLDNLVGNAIKYVRHGDTATITVGARREPDGWRIEVADRGIGIPAEQRQAVFTAFHRDRAAEGYPGTGLGLAICKRIVERHGGHIGVEANPGGGSRFWFTLSAGPDRRRSDRRQSPVDGAVDVEEAATGPVRA